MPKASPHFDAGALCAAVLAVEVGLQIKTSDPAAFRRIMYKHMRQHPHQKIGIHEVPNSPNRFMLLREASVLEPTHG